MGDVGMVFSVFGGDGHGERCVQANKWEPVLIETLGLGPIPKQLSKDSIFPERGGCGARVVR